MHTIYLEIENEILTGRITEVYNPIQNMAYMEFNNGYANIFFVDCETGNWMEQDLGFTNLAKIAGEELQHIINNTGRIRNDLNWYKKIINGELFHFGFYKYLSGEMYIYEIFASNKRYMFSLVKKRPSVWQIFKISGAGGWKYNAKYEEIVPYLLDTYYL